MKKIKSAFEIAMEKAEKMNADIQTDTSLEKKEKLKPLMSKFFKNKIGADELWQELKEEKDEELLLEAQVLILDSLGLRSSSEEFNRRRKGILAIESLKSTQKSSLLEQTLNQLEALKQRYIQEKEQIENQLKKIRENNSEVRMRPVKTKDGRTVMQLESDVDENTKREFSQKIAQFEKMYGDRFNQLVNSLVNDLKDN